MEYDVVLYPITLLRPSEEVNMAHVEALTKEIVRCQRWTTPIPIEKETGIIMDGNHRYQVAHHLALTYIPCVLLDYTDTRITVYDWQNGRAFSPLRIREQILKQGNIFPYKTTRHLFSPSLPAVNFPLEQLVEKIASNHLNVFKLGVGR